MKVAVLGASQNSLGLAPFSDPDWTFIGCGGIYPRLPLFNAQPAPWDRIWWAEVHDQFLLRGQQFGTVPPYGHVYIPWLRNMVQSGGRVFLKDPMAEIPGADIIDRDAIGELTPIIRDMNLGPQPHRYLTNSITFMMAIAYMECLKVDPDPSAHTIGLWGVDMMVANMDQNQEYSFQRPSCEHFIGFLQGKGVNVVLPPECDLLLTAYEYGDKEAIEYRRRIIARQKASQVNLVNMKNQVAQLNAQIARTEGGVGMLKWIEHCHLPGDTGDPGATMAPHGGGNIAPTAARPGQPANPSANGAPVPRVIPDEVKRAAVLRGLKSMPAADREVLYQQLKDIVEAPG